MKRLKHNMWDNNLPYRKRKSKIRKKDKRGDSLINLIPDWKYDENFRMRWS